MKKQKTIIISILTVICALIAITSAFAGPLLSKYLSYKFSINTKDLGSIGIIGGADGPTAIFVTGHINFYWVTAVFSLLTILGVIFLIKINRTKTNKAE